MIIYHGNFFVDTYLTYIEYKKPTLKYNLKVFHAFSLIFLLVSIVLTALDIHFIRMDFDDYRVIELTIFLGLAILFDIIKLYYMHMKDYMMMVMMAIVSISLISVVLRRTKNINKEDGKKIRSIAETGIVFLLLSLISSTIYHAPTFKQLFFNQ